MEASRVIFSPKTVAEIHEKLIPRRKKELRREAVLAYIRNKPYGKRLKTVELLSVTDLTTNSGAHMYLKNLVRDGYITQHQLGLRSSFYTVNEPVRSYIKKPTPLPEVAVEEPKSDEQASEETLEARAMRFGWEHPLYNNDLREFIKWVKENK